MEKIAVGLELTRRWTDPPIVLAVGLIVGIPSFIVITILLSIYVHVLTFPVPALLLWFFYNFIYMRTPPAPTDKYVVFKDKSLGKKFGKRKIPVCILYEAFIREQVDFTKDVYLTLQERDQFICYRPSFTLLKFLVLQVFPSTSSSFHNKKADEKEIKLHYDRGNDFFAGFLGPSMIYTSPVYHGLQQSLEEAQANKCSLVCSKLQVGMGKTMLDIGCGWGTLARHAAKKFFAKSTGVTLSKEQHQWCEQKTKEEGLESSVTFLHRDYRDIPLNAPYDAISAIEMAEHVGIRNFQAFLTRVSQLLKDDGLFLMQVSGLRKGSDWEDIMWGLFMSKYIFPGADASTPLNWYVKQMEQAGFEIRSVETIGKHYSHGIMQWYRNWESNKASLVGKYGEPLCRLWSFFLAWSVIASGQGTATCFQILAHKNKSSFNRDVFTSQDTHVGMYSKDSKF